MHRLADTIARHRRLLAAVLIIGAVVPASFLPRMGVDNAIEVWLRRESPEFRTYREFLRRFGTDEFVVVAMNTDGPCSAEALRTQRRLADGLRKVDGVEDVLDLASMYDLIEGVFPGRGKAVQSDPLLRDFLVGADGRTVGVFAWLKHLEGAKARRRVVMAIEAVAAETTREGGPDLHLAGTPLMNVSLDRASERAAVTLLPVAMLVSVLMLAIMLRRAGAVAAPLCSVGVAVAWTLGVMAMTGRQLNMVTVVLPSLLFVLTLSNAIHLTSRFLSHRVQLGDSDAASGAALRELIRPALLSSITTAAGFASLLVSDMEPVRDLGGFAALGMLIGLACNLCIVPALLTLFCGRNGRVTRVPHAAWASAVGARAARAPWALTGAGALLLAGWAAMATRVGTESNVLKFFPPDSRIARDYAFVGDRLTGFYTLELDMGVAAAEEPDALAAIQRLSEAVAARPEVARVTHIGSPTSFPGGMANLDAALARRFRRVEDSAVNLRMAILVRAMASSEFDTLVEFVQSSAEQVLPATITRQLTGVVSLLIDVQQSLLETQTKSLSIAAVTVIVMIGVLFASFRAALASVLPNVLPIAGVFALMAAAGIPLDPATVMIAGVAIGIAVDDTIHFLARYREERWLGLGPVEATVATLDKIGSAMFFTSVVAAAGFSVLCLAEFRPVARFGLLTGFTMLTAFAADLLVLPACARAGHLWEKK